MAKDKKVNIKIKVDDRGSKKKLGGFKSSLLSIKSVLLGGIGILGLNRALRETVGRAQSAETGLKRLGVAMKSASRFSDENLQSFERLAVTLERTTGFMEEDVLQALSVLQTFGQMTREDMEKTIMASLNMATVFNEDLTQASIRLGKAYNGQLIGLQRMGVKISKATFNAKGFQAVLEQLGKEQGGQAVARMKGFEGSVNRVTVAFGEVGKEVGKFITKNKSLRTVLNSLAGGMQIWANLLRKVRTSTIAHSSATKKLTQDLNDQKKALASVGREIENNVLIQRKQELILIQRQIDKEEEIERKRKEREQRVVISNRLAALSTIQESKLIRLKEKRAELELKIAQLESNRQVEGSKANRTEIAEELKQIKLVKEEEAEVKRLNEVWGKNFQGADQVKAAYEGVAASQEKRRRGAKEAADAEKESLDEAKKVAEELEDIETDRLDGFFSRLRLRADGIKKFNEERLAAAMDIANKELAANERLQQKILDIRTGAVKQALQDELLSEVARSILLDEQEAKAIALFEALQNGSKGSAVELEKNITKLEQQRDILQDVEGAEAITEILRLASNEAAVLVEQLGRAKLSPDIDVNAIKLQMRTTGEAAADEFRIAFENRLRTQPIKIPNVELTPPSFTNGGG